MSLPGPLLEQAIPFAIRLHREFRGVTTREGMLIHGPSGWGEFAPFEDYDDASAGRWLASAVEAAFGRWPATLRTAISVNAIIPAVPADVAGQLAREAVLRDGCTTVKVKVTGDLRTDEARVASIRDALDAALGRGVGRIRIDANACWTTQEATTALRRLSAYGLEYVEQPVVGTTELRALRAVIDVPIAVDESIRTDPTQGAQALRALAEVADIAILKPAPIGGVQRACDLAADLRMPIVVSSSMDSSVGLSAALALAGALDIDRACGLGTGALLATDVVAEPLVPKHGVLVVQRVAPDLEALLAARALLPPERVQFWRDRLLRAWNSVPPQTWGALLTSNA